MDVEVEVLPHGKVWFQATGLSLDYGVPDHIVSDQLTPDEAEDIARRLIAAAREVRRG
jgi:hypothetical protein